jgi:hypothetical protein
MITAGALIAAVNAQAASLTNSGYTETFDELGTGTSLAPASGWAVEYLSGSNTTWTNSTGIPGNGTNSVASMIAGSSTLLGPETTAASLSGLKNTSSAYNVSASIANSSASSTDVALATSPTVDAGIALQLTITNNTGSALSNFGISYDIDRFTVASAANELPGYQLFYSTDGSTWTNVGALNPTLTNVPNTVGVTNVSGVVNLYNSVANGSNLELRWVDDDASQSSPDQMIGLNNVDITPVPLPASLPLLVCALGAVTLLGGVKSEKWRPSRASPANACRRFARSWPSAHRC